MSKEALSASEVGKFVGGYLYLHTTALPDLSEAWRQATAKAIELARVRPDHEFNVIKLHQHGEELSLLDYRNFFDDPFPSLGRSWRVSLSRGSVVYRTYEESRNPPILHRKELLLPTSHHRLHEYRAMTEAAEALGLFSETNRIGFRAQWHALIRERGYELVAGQFRPLANSVTDDGEACASDGEEGIGVRRHLTALTRSNFSSPIQALLRHGLVGKDTRFFDYGCGKGDDVRNLCANGVTASGWDPYYAKDAPKRSAHTVNLGFVINVIEDLDERVAALRGAYDLTKGVLAVAAMLTSQCPADGRPYRDGYLSLRNTFQKYYSQAQLRDFIEHTLDENAIAVVPGVFFVFRDKELEQRFLAARYGQQSRSSIQGWSYVSQTRLPKPPRTVRESRESRDSRPALDRTSQLFMVNQDDFEQLWLRFLELGRPAEKHEVDEVLRARLEQAVGSWAKTTRIAVDRFPVGELSAARAARVSDLVVFGAQRQFEKRAVYRELEPGLRADVRYFFGDHATWQASTRTVLFDIGNVACIDAACREAAAKGYGYLEEGHSLQLHISLLERLPTVLRVYVACATMLCGDISEFDLVKIHIRSGKSTLLKFEDFEGHPLPRLLQRVKVNLRDQDLDVFAYGADYPPTLLYHKSRFINEEFLHFAEQLAFEEGLDKLGLHDLSGYGPSETAFNHALADARWEIDGFALRRATGEPNIDDPCGANLTYRDLIECGETQARTGLANRPKEPDTYTALYELAKHVLDPVIDYYGMVKLTYGFCSQELAKQIKGHIAPELDQHAGHEQKKTGKPVCERLGAACDFLVEDEDMEEVANWVFENTEVDRVYFYGKDRPIHVSYSGTPARQLVAMLPTHSGRRVPRVLRKALLADDVRR
ncbi:DNA phosphorothioation-associated putative methyltransferase [Massilia sp. BHUDP2]|uniref:DNA phosphorothioation-associated putative methyltransferase n=1 Tax=Massilia sp. BHUDP2 TaxID=3034505 RepID=UPI003905F777